MTDTGIPVSQRKPSRSDSILTPKAETVESIFLNHGCVLSATIHSRPRPSPSPLVQPQNNRSTDHQSQINFKENNQALLLLTRPITVFPPTQNEILHHGLLVQSQSSLLNSTQQKKQSQTSTQQSDQQSDQQGDQKIYVNITLQKVINYRSLLNKTISKAT